MLLITNWARVFQVDAGPVHTCTADPTLARYFLFLYQVTDQRSNLHCLGLTIGNGPSAI